jgi:hypothetical protein
MVVLSVPGSECLATVIVVPYIHGGFYPADFSFVQDAEK